MNHILKWESIEDGVEFPLIIKDGLQKALHAHSHDFYEIVYVADGFILHEMGGRNALLLAGDIIAIRPGEAHMYRGRSSASIINVLFKKAALGEMLSEICLLPGMEDFFSERDSTEWQMHAHLDLEKRDRIVSLFREIQRERQEKETGWKVRSVALLTEVMVEFSRIFNERFLASRGVGGYAGYVAKAMEYIGEHYRDDISIAQVADIVGINPDYMTRQFHRFLGITPSEYLRRLRFARAIELLREQNTVGDVCRQTGFAHMSHFSREFKETFGISPSQYARKHAGTRGEKG